MSNIWGTIAFCHFDSYDLLNVDRNFNKIAESLDVLVFIRWMGAQILNDLCKFKNRDLTTILLAFLFLFTMVACSTATEATPVPVETSETVDETDNEAEESVEEPVEEAASEEKVLVIGHLESTESYDPAHGLVPTSIMVNHATYDTLVTFLDSGANQIEPNLAVSWTLSEDGLTYAFTLREDVVFANGDALTAEDVVFSFNRLKHVQSNPSFLTDPIDFVEAIDEHYCGYHLVEPRPSFLTELVHPAFSVTNDDESSPLGVRMQRMRQPVIGHRISWSKTL